MNKKVLNKSFSAILHTLLRKHENMIHEELFCGLENSKRARDDFEVAKEAVFGFVEKLINLKELKNE